jgi:asparagine synthase (glutamine-hydrolysing)
MTFVAGVLRHADDAAEICSRMLQRSGLSPASTRFISVSPGLTLSISLSAILPEDSYDHQPLSNDRYVLVGDIRIDNRAEVAAKLSLSAAQTREMADSDLFFCAWQKWQQDCLLHIIGGFAVAVWDRQEKELCLVRDHSGERPIYYASNGSSFAFASLAQALRGVEGIDTSLNEEQLMTYLILGPDSGTATCFRNILRLQHGHLVTFREGKVVCSRYWHPGDTPPTRLGSNEEYVEALLERFDLAVKARLRTNGKIGSQLSGGMDSSSVTATAAMLLGNTRLTAFTAVPASGFTDLNPIGRFGNEGPDAARVAAMYANIEHVLIEPSELDLLEVMEKTGCVTGTPVFNPTNQMWINAILDEARRRGIHVLLHGTAGNLTVSFGGMVGLSDLLKTGRWMTLVRQVLTLRSNGHTSWRGAAYWAAGYALPLSIRKRMSPEMRAFDFCYSPVHPDRAREHQLRDRAFKAFFASEKNSESHRRELFDYYDSAFMTGATSLGWQISLRDPMADKRIYEFCLSIPVEQYLAEGQSRSLVRRAMRGRLPPEILANTTRGLQAADWYLTLGSRRAEMAAELKRIRQSPMAQRLLDLDRLERLVETWPSSGYEQPDVYNSWHLALSRGLAAGNFIRHHEGNG